MRLVKSPSPEIESGSDDFLHFDGITSFNSTHAYRYAVTLKSGQLRIWFEDCESKTQWCTPNLRLDDFVNPTNVMPSATAKDYVEYFHDLLDGNEDDVDGIPVAFERLEGETFQLSITVKIQVLRQSRLATYRFHMEPISLERIDVLESKMRDLEAKVQTLCCSGNHVNSNTDMLTLKSEVKELRLAQDTTEILQAKATAKEGQWISWEGFPNGIVKVEASGTYCATVVVNYQTDGNNSAIQLFRVGECIQIANCGGTRGFHSSTSMKAIVSVKQNEQVDVLCPMALVGTSHLTLVRLGN